MLWGRESCDSLFCQDPRASSRAPQNLSARRRSSGGRRERARAVATPLEGVRAGINIDLEAFDRLARGLLNRGPKCLRLGRRQGPIPRGVRGVRESCLGTVEGSAELRHERTLLFEAPGFLEAQRELARTVVGLNAACAHGARRSPARRSKRALGHGGELTNVTLRRCLRSGRASWHGGPTRRCDLLLGSGPKNTARLRARSRHAETR